METRWYRNLSLEQQVSVDFTSSFVKYLDNKYSLLYNGYCFIRLNYLWVLSDRILWESQINSTLSSAKNRNSSENTDWRTNHSHRILSRFSYYIENRVRFTCTIYVSLNRNDKLYYPVYHAQNSFGINFGMEYYLDRKLF